MWHTEVANDIDQPICQPLFGDYFFIVFDNGFVNHSEPRGAGVDIQNHSNWDTEMSLNDFTIDLLYFLVVALGDVFIILAATFITASFLYSLIMMTISVVRRV